MNKVTKYFRSTVKDLNEDGFRAKVVISDESKDRYDERVLVSSFKKTIPMFMKHPVLLSSHTYRGLLNQIGMFKSIEIDKKNKEVVGEIEYFVGEGNLEADWAWTLAKKGIAAFSIGFIPTKSIPYNEDEMKENGGIVRDFSEIELLETSQVLIPANPNALQKSFEGVDPLIKELTEEAVEKFKDETEGIYVDEEEKAEKEAAESETDSGAGENPAAEGDPLTKEEEDIETRKWDETDNEIRHRVRDPEDFDKFRYITLQKKKPRIRAIYGHVKETEDDWKIQALRFPKEDGWTMDSAKAWVKEHPEVVKALEYLEEADFSGWQAVLLLDVNFSEIAPVKDLVDVLKSLIGRAESILKKEEGEKEVEKEEKEEEEDPMGSVLGEEKMKELREMLGLPVESEGDIGNSQTIKQEFNKMNEELRSLFSVLPSSNERGE